MKEYIIVIDDNEILCGIIYEQLKARYGPRYSIARFYDSVEAQEFIRDYIDREGDRLCLTATDERLKGSHTGHELLENLSKTHPKSKKLLFSAYSDTQALISAINIGINGFVSKGKEGSAGDEFFAKVDKLTTDYENDLKVEYTFRDIKFKLAETLFEKCQFLSKRYEIYLQVGHKSVETLREEELKNKMEWDRYDLGGINSMVLTPLTRYVVAMKGGQCIGGARIIDGEVPLESGICESEGFGLGKGNSFTLNHLTERIYRREISRLIVDPNYRDGSHIILLGLFQMINQLTCEQNTLLCTAKKEQVGLYKLIGFEEIGPMIRYSLDGLWTPMMLSRERIQYQSNLIPGFNQSMYEKATRRIPTNDIEKWSEYSRALNKAAIESGYYVQKNN